AAAKGAPDPRGADAGGRASRQPGAPAPGAVRARAGSRFQHARGAHPLPAQGRRPRAHRDGARLRLQARCAMSFRLSHLAILLALSILAAAIGGVAATWRVADEAFRDVLDEDLENQSELLAELLAADGVDLDEDALEDLLDEAFEPEGEETLWVTVYDLRTGGAVSNFSHDLPLDDPEREHVRR